VRARYGSRCAASGYRVLIDHVWPRGVSRDRGRDRGSRPGLRTPTSAGAAQLAAITLRAFATATTAPGAIRAHRRIALLQGAAQARLSTPSAQGRKRRGRASTCSRGRIARSPTSRPRCTAPTAASQSDEHRPLYLDEYVFSHNRRGTPMAAFQTLLRLSALHDPTTYAQITDHNPASLSQPDMHYVAWRARTDPGAR